MDEPRMAEKLLTAARIDYDALGRSMMTYDEKKLSDKREYWFNKTMRPFFRQEARREKVMNLLVCPVCMDDKTTRHLAARGPFIKSGNGMIHEPSACPHKNGTIVKIVDKP